MVRFPIPVLVCCMIGCDSSDGGPAPDPPDGDFGSGHSPGR